MTRVEPPQRKYAERVGPRRRDDMDSALLAFKSKARVFAIVLGVVFTPIGLMLAELMEAKGWALLPYFFVGPVVGVFVYYATLVVSDGGGTVIGKVYHPSGQSTPTVRDYSQAKALVMQGHYPEAIEVYEDAVTIHPEDPEPYVQIARLYRDKLSDYEQSVSWFKRARNESAMDAGRELLVTEEIIEIYRLKLDEPRRAIPELARMLQKYPDHPSADGARREIEDLRRQIAESREHHIRGVDPDG